MVPAVESGPKLRILVLHSSLGRTVADAAAASLGFEGFQTVVFPYGLTHRLWPNLWPNVFSLWPNSVCMKRREPSSFFVPE